MIIEGDSGVPVKYSEIKKRFIFLRVICALTFIESIAGILLYLSLITGGSFKSFFESIPVYDTIVKEDSIGSFSFFILKILFFSLSSGGIILIWKLRRSGYWIYVGSRILILLTPHIFLMSSQIPFLWTRTAANAILSVFIILIFTFQLRRF